MAKVNIKDPATLIVLTDAIQKQIIQLVALGFSLSQGGDPTVSDLQLIKTLKLAEDDRGVVIDIDIDEAIERAKEREAAAAAAAGGAST
jgi:hypothetical protein